MIEFWVAGIVLLWVVAVLICFEDPPWAIADSSDEEAEERLRKEITAQRFRRGDFRPPPPPLQDS